MNKLFVLAAVAMFVACASPKNTASKSYTGQGDTRTKDVVYLNGSTFLLTDTTADKSYGFDPKNAVKVGSDDGGGPTNERRFLNALLGPNGEAVGYDREGSCCAFKTPHGLIENMGMLDRYKVYWTGASDTVVIFINMYDKGDLKIPVGFTAKKKS